MPGPVVIVEPTIFTDPNRASDRRQFLVFLQNQCKTVAFFEQSGPGGILQHEGFRFKQPVLYHKPEVGQAVVHFVGKVLGEGGDGTVVYDLAQTNLVDSDLKFQQAGYRQPQVLKVQQGSRLTYAEQEYQHSQRAKHLAMQKPLIAANRQSFLVMNKIPGRELFDIISEDYGRQRVLTIPQRMELSYKILEAMKTQVYDKGLIHHDIKPENIMVDLGPPMAVNIIDYGFSSEQTLHPIRGSKRGTPPYSPLELCRKSSPYVDSTKTDSFSIGRVLVDIWGRRDKRDDSYDFDDWGQMEGYLISKYDERGLFLLEKSFLEGLDPSLKNSVKKLVEGLLQREPKDRLSLDKAFLMMHQCYDDYLKEKGLPSLPLPKPQAVATSASAASAASATSFRARPAQQPETISARRQRLHAQPDILTTIKEDPEFEDVSLHDNPPTAKRKSLAQQSSRRPDEAASVAVAVSPTTPKSFRWRYPLAAVGATIFAGLGVALLFTGILAPLGLGALVLAGVIAGMAVAGGAIGFGVGSQVDKSKRSQAMVEMSSEESSVPVDAVQESTVTMNSLLGCNPKTPEPAVRPGPAVHEAPAAQNAADVKPSATSDDSEQRPDEGPKFR